MSKFKVKATSTQPEGSAQWLVDLGEDPVLAAIYTNLAYALIARAMVRLGAAATQAQGGDTAQLHKLAEEAGVDGFSI